MNPGDILRARKSFSFAWPKPDSARRIEVQRGDQFPIDRVLSDGCVRVTIATGERVDFKLKHFERVTR
jgi:hypothetical protein